MRNIVYTLIIASLLFGCSSSDDSEAKISYPPESLSQWYKPENKRQVWLHTMFRLRREMLAVNIYAEQKDFISLKKWTDKLEKDYRKIEEMVPEWKSKIKPQLFSEIHSAIDDRNAEPIKKVLHKLEKTCTSCHDRYRPIVAALFRSPEYDDIRVETQQANKDQSFIDSMIDVSKSINQILIALDDDKKSNALNAHSQLDSQLKFMSKTCSNCHKDNVPEQRIFGPETQQRIAEIKSGIQQDRVKDTKKLLGEIGVTVCARCHGTHRTLSDLNRSLKLD
jgi:cytochrome c556